MIAVGYGLGRFLHWTPTESLFLGAALSISSTTIIIKALTELKLKHAPFAELVLGVLVVEDLLAILLLVGLPLLAISGATVSGPAVVTGTLFHAIVKLILVISAWFLVGYFVVPTIFKKWLRQINDELLIVISVALCFCMVSLAAYFGYSVALGAFIMGSILAETENSKRIEHLIHPLRDIFAAVFFVAIGMLINPLEIWHHFGIVLLITAVTIVGKIFGSFCGAYFSTRRGSISTQVGLSMAQIGEFSFIITGLGVSLNLLNLSFYPIIVAVSAITTFTTPYFIKIAVWLAANVKTWDQGPISYQRKSTRSLGKFRAMLREHFMTYVLNVILVAIIFKLMGLILPFEKHSANSLFWENVVFALFYLGAAPFITMLLITPIKGSSVIFKILGLAIALLELYFFMRHQFAHFANFIIWFVVVLVLSFSLQKLWCAIYAWLAAHLYGNLKEE